MMFYSNIDQEYYFKGYALYRRPLLPPRDCHLGGLVPPFWHPGYHVSTSGAPWVAMLALRDNPGGPWEQQDRHEVFWNRIFIDFGVIWGPVYISFLI